VSERDDRILPDRTSDEQDVGWGDRPADDAADDERLQRDVPPHHGSAG
jgi:hypothetical protein